MQTYCSEKSLRFDPEFKKNKTRALKELAKTEIDAPIQDVITELNRLPFCYTLQCCYGHFTSSEQPDKHNLSIVSKSGPSDDFLYRIAYVAFCIDATSDGKQFLSALRGLPSKTDTKTIQFGCAQWFWDQCVNSYVLQVQPTDHADVDSLHVSRKEALCIQSVRNRFWDVLRTTMNGNIP